MHLLWTVSPRPTESEWIASVCRIVSLFFFCIYTQACPYRFVCVCTPVYVHERCTSTATTCSCVCVAWFCSWWETCFDTSRDLCQSKHRARLDWGAWRGVLSRHRHILPLRLGHLVWYMWLTGLWSNCSSCPAQLSGWSMALFIASSAQGKHTPEQSSHILQNTHNVENIRDEQVTN